MRFSDEISDDEYERLAMTMPPSPRKGDQLFRGDLDDWTNNADLNEGGRYTFARGYQRAAELLVQHVIKSGSEHHYLVYPIIFLYRHHVELALKRILAESPRLLGRELTISEKAHLDRHRLDDLWQDVKPLFNELYDALAWDKPDEADVDGIDDYICQLSKVDPNSYSFRCEFSKKGDLLLPTDLKQINLRHFAEMMERLISYVNRIDTAASCYEEWRDEMQGEEGYGY